MIALGSRLAAAPSRALFSSSSSGTDSTTNSVVSSSSSTRRVKRSVARASAARSALTMPALTATPKACSIRPRLVSGSRTTKVT